MQTNLRGLSVGDKLVMRREWHNPKDSNALLITWLGYEVGYLPRSMAGRIAEADEWEVEVAELLGSHASGPHGLRVRLTPKETT